MPEAPEVQTVINELAAQLSQSQIDRVEITHEKLAANMPAQEMADRLAGQHFVSFARRGKYLIFELDDYDLIAHMRMEGKFIVYDQLPEDPKIRKHLHALFYLDDGRILAYKDTRKFGRMNLYDKAADPFDLPVFDKIGPDVLDDAFNAAYLEEKLKNRRSAIKTALLDQAVVAGIGNIYADEILFQAGLDPRSAASHLDHQDLEKIVEAAKSILEQAIAHKGTTIRTFSYDGSHAGSYQDQLKVHDRQDEPCLHCQGKIEHVKINQRSTYYCPQCQIRK